MTLRERVKELSKYGELIAGDKKERLIVDKIKEYFEVNKITTYINPQNVLKWEEKEIELECEGIKIKAISLPYSPSIDVETSDYQVIKINNILDVNKYYRNNSNKILVFTQDDLMRKIVLKNGTLLSHLPQNPPRLPAFYIRYKDANQIKGKCRFFLKSSFEESIGYTIEGIIPGKTEDKIYVTAHHDHWFKGEHDDLISVSILPELKSEKYELHLISFTAEESGCFFSSFSWACGSYNFLRSNKIDAKLSISLDNLTLNSKFFVTPGLFKYFKNAVQYPSPYTDSYNFLKRGIPTISMSDIDYPYYHSEADEISETENYEEIVKLLNVFLSNEITINPQELVNVIFDTPLPIEIKELALNLIERGKYNELLKFYGSILDLSKNTIQTYLFHKLVGINKAYENSVAIEDFVELRNYCEDEICSKLYEKFLYYLQKEITNEYLIQLKNLF
ncbi:M28 family peptidase [Sulfurisphaera ohwakuensis]|uniref:Iap family predicted aminopeptidase n=1 Tax=Sulfurisphaera ohwakuensis TaxID=69656 RepID=A0A650CE99_SULOH|nr:M28 family peptidase [Sulfurisphaera ohwakuensis]MBB5252986.1 Iap family predicted aminopeptidase [Sulfurisphaera ohwakuensis]QGR16088.1 M28 family peptidase [Sulfurisphaera ohwakuensis]